MAKLDETEDLDALIDRAVDTFFVEEPGPEERAALDEPQDIAGAEIAPEPESPAAAQPSFDEAVDTLFGAAFQEEPSGEVDFSPPTPGSSPFQQAPPGPTEDFSMPEASPDSYHRASEPTPDFSTSTTITSGDADTDRAIDLAVDTLFVEEPETPAPETTQLEVSATVPLDEPEPPPIDVSEPSRDRDMPRNRAPEPEPQQPVMPGGRSGAGKKEPGLRPGNGAGNSAPHAYPV